MARNTNGSTGPAPIAILGAGSWGTALALHLSRLGQPVHLWTLDGSHAQSMATERCNNLYLPGHAFPDTLQPTADLKIALSNVQDILIAVPSVGYRSVLKAIHSHLVPSTRIISATKGLDEETGSLLHTVALGSIGTDRPFAVLSGPSFALEVAKGLPTAIVIATEHEQFAQDLVERFNSKHFRVYLSHDMIGVEMGGVVKNVLAIATGISDGMGFGANARSALITRGLAEMVRLGTALGGRYETLNGLAGLGDLILTCTDDQSRNRRFGLGLGKGKDVKTVEQEIGQVIEGKRNAAFVMELAKKSGVEMPIVESVWNILQGKLTANEALENLLSRSPKIESS